MIYIHIGLPKSGSSAIQVYLNDNAKELEKLGVFYPWPYEYRQKYRTDGGNAKKILQIARNGYNKDEVVALKKEINDFNQKYNNIIISSEVLSVFFDNPNDLKNLLPDNDDIKVVIYLRNQVDKFVSDVNQTIKTGMRDNYNISPRWFMFNNYYEQIKKWASVFGDSNLIIKTYNKKSLYNNDVVQDFCQLIDIPFIGYDKNEPINPSLSFEYLELMRIINHYSSVNDSPEIKRRVKDFIWESSVNSKSDSVKYDGKQAIPFSTDILSNIATKLSESNIALEKEYNLEPLDLKASVDKYVYIKPEIDHFALYDVISKMVAKKKRK